MVVSQYGDHEVEKWTRNLTSFRVPIITIPYKRVNRIFLRNDIKIARSKRDIFVSRRKSAFFPPLFVGGLKRRYKRDLSY